MALTRIHPISQIALAIVTITIGASLVASCRPRSQSKTLKQDPKQTEYEARKSKIKAAFNQIGDIELDPRKLTLAKLNQILQTEGKKSDRQRYTNTTTLEWFDDAIRATFKTEKQVRESEKPFEIEMQYFPSYDSYATPYFLGSIYGVHINDSLDDVLNIVRKRGCKPNTSVKYNMYAKCKGAVTVGWSEDNGKITKVEISVGNYWVFPG